MNADHVVLAGWLAVSVAGVVSIAGVMAADAHDGVWPRGLRWWPRWWAWLARSVARGGRSLFYPEPGEPGEPGEPEGEKGRVFTCAQLDHQWREATQGGQIPFWREGVGWQARPGPSREHPEINEIGDWE